jgi:hypothetical protein
MYFRLQSPLQVCMICLMELHLQNCSASCCCFANRFAKVDFDFQLTVYLLSLVDVLLICLLKERHKICHNSLIKFGGWVVFSVAICKVCCTRGLMCWLGYWTVCNLWVLNYHHRIIYHSHDRLIRVPNAEHFCLVHPPPLSSPSSWPSPTGMMGFLGRPN